MYNTQNWLGGGVLLTVVLLPLLLLHNKVQVLDDLLDFDVEVGLDVADGPLLPLRLPQQRLLGRHQFIDRALGTHQNVPHLEVNPSESVLKTRETNQKKEKKKKKNIYIY